VRDLRAAFPILSRVAYLNAGTDGPVAEAARTAARAAVDAQAEEGRFLPHFEARMSGQAALRAGYASLLGCDIHDVALTTSTSEGIGKVLAGLDLGPQDEIVTSDQEHPGLIGPLLTARERGARIRTAPLASLASAVRSETTLVACSHVGWVTGELADRGLRDTGVPVVLDGAQGVGAIPVDVRELGCAAYAAAGQKWLCGADGTGMLYVEPEFDKRLRAVAPAYMAFEDTSRGLDSPLHPDARRHDTASLPREGVAFSLAALGVLDAAGWDAVLSGGPALAAQLADRLREHGRAVAPRDHTTLVSWEEADPLATRGRLLEAGVVVRDLPGTSYVRASVGAWNDAGDLDRLLAALP
jgi:L-cysteine/cystine lyase